MVQEVVVMSPEEADRRDAESTISKVKVAFWLITGALVFWNSLKFALFLGIKSTLGIWIPVAMALTVIALFFIADLSNNYQLQKITKGTLSIVLAIIGVTLLFMAITKYSGDDKSLSIILSVTYLVVAFVNFKNSFMKSK